MTQYMTYITIVLLMVLLYKVAKLFINSTLEIFRYSSEWIKVALITIILMFSFSFMWKLLESLRISFAAIIS